MTQRELHGGAKERKVSGAGEAWTRRLAAPPLCLYAVAVFLSASLVFWVQPLAVRALLPVLGGSPLVWNTSLVFFQLSLLLGYALAHLLAAVLRRRGQLLVLGALWCVALLTARAGGVWLLGGTPPQAGSGPFAFLLPALWLLGTLAGVFGPACLAVSTLTPLVSSWLSRSEHGQGGVDPYILYAASNVGSLGVLLLYPFVLEPLLGVAFQIQLWQAVFVVLFPLLALLAVWQRTPDRQEASDDASRPPLASGRILILALIPSGLLYGVTQRLTADVVSAPLLWMLPLALYLGTYVLAFGRRRLLSRHRETLESALVPLALVVFAVFHEVVEPGLGSVGWHLTLFGVAALYCHGLLADLRPPAGDLTRFYMLVSAGGFAGGVVVTLASPLVFAEVLEYPFLFCAVALLLHRSGDKAPSTRARIYAAVSVVAVVTLLALVHGGALAGTAGLIGLAGLLPFMPGLLFVRRHPALLAASLLAVALTPAAMRAWVDDGAFRQRTFFGVYRVMNEVMEVDGSERSLRVLLHGRALHGLDWFLPGGGVESRTVYYAPGGPVGQVFEALKRERPEALRIGLAGLGVGSLLCHARQSDAIRVYEIDPLVVSLAHSHFAALGACGSNATVSVGDARLLIAEEADASLDVLVLDAFSSGNIPVHLLTAEAFADYLRVLAEGGLLLVHGSERVLDLEPLLGLMAKRFELKGAVWHHPGTADWLKMSRSHWVILARDREILQGLALKERWRYLEARDPSWWRRAWTDDVASIIPYLRW
ncbi:MAG: fused MFS/spermidine synthase [Candidatus Tectomicrobia bacterium]|nr:fused MFS/spermidine synthase [Candidatus Tectomicrobia bacterium]